MNGVLRAQIIISSHFLNERLGGEFNSRRAYRRHRLIRSFE